MEVPTEGLLRQNPPPDKSADFLAHIAHLKMVQAMAEEVVYRELIAV